MTGRCAYPIYYQRVVNVENGKGDKSIQKKLAELIKKGLLGGQLIATLPRPCFKHDMRLYLSFEQESLLGGESKPALPRPCFKHDSRVVLSDILPDSCQC
jgi:hypothetical protein